MTRELQQAEDARWKDNVIIINRGRREVATGQKQRRVHISAVQIQSLGLVPHEQFLSESAGERSTLSTSNASNILAKYSDIWNIFFIYENIKYHPNILKCQILVVLRIHNNGDLCFGSHISLSGCT